MAGRFRDNIGSMEEQMTLERLEGLGGFDRIVYRFARGLSMSGSITLKAASPTKKVTTVDKIVRYLQEIGATDFESGKSTDQIGKGLDLKKVTIQKCLPELRDRGLVKSEQHGKQIHYFLPK